jgi:hypothetical protein
VPFAVITDFTNGNLGALASSGIQRNRRGLKLTFAQISTAITLREIRRFIPIVKTINRAALIAVKPGTVTSEGNEISKRYIGVVPHRYSRLRTGLLDPIR